ncbi:MAG: DUF4388 domain-containing protein [candidate division Zixibacteria bacterium]|nr:DUF4388 domain-containing protein [candidate division Zixibacteria bacterium]
MDMQGKIEEFNIPDVFKTIASDQRGGTLGIIRGGKSALLYFDNGQLTYAFSPNNNNRLGERLIAKNIIDKNALEKSIITQKNQDSQNRIGKILIENKHIDEKQLKDSLIEQVADIAFQVMTWHSGVYKFYDGKFPTEEDMVFSLPTENIISEGIKRTDELRQLSEKLPDFSAFLKLKTIPRESEVELKLTAEQWNILACCDGRHNIHKMLNESDVDPITILRTLIKFIDDDLIAISFETASEKSEADYSKLELQIDTLSDLLRKFLAEG